MIRPSPSHRLLNLVQTMLILGGMAAIAWVVLGPSFISQGLQQWLPRTFVSVKTPVRAWCAA